MFSAIGNPTSGFLPSAGTDGSVTRPCAFLTSGFSRWPWQLPVNGGDSALGEESGPPAGHRGSFSGLHVPGLEEDEQVSL